MNFGIPFAVNFAAVAVTAQQDLFSLIHTTKPIQLIALYLHQHSDFGDAQAEILEWNIKTGATSAGSAGSSLTAKNPHGDTAGTTARSNDTTIANTGTIVTHHSDGWNVAAGLIWIPTVDMQDFYTIPLNTRVVIGLASTPADSLTMDGTLYFREIG